MKRFALVPAVCLAIGCGSGGHAPDGAPVSVTTITPADGATKVTPLTDVTIQLSGAADATSITAQTVRLWVGDSKRPVVAGVSYDDASHAITLAPAYPLGLGQSYRVELDGVTGGGPIAATSHFRTVYNPTISGTNYDVAGTVISRADYEYDVNGVATATVMRTAGTDGVLGTADDGTASWISTTSPSAMVVRVIGYSGAGTDGTWRTADDVISSYGDSTSSAAGTIHTVTYTGPGPDGVWLTADDKAQTFGDFTYDDSDRDSRDVFTFAGADGKVGTADDTTSEWYAQVYGAAFDYDRIDYTGPGVDGTWFTADDKTPNFDHVTSDDRGGLLSDGAYVTGADGKPSTPDDAETGLYTYEHDTHGLLSRIVTHAAAGADGTWGTADDTIGSYFEYTHDAQGNLTEHATFSVGADGVPFTADDYKTYIEQHDASL